MTATEAILEVDDRNFTINFGPQHPAARGFMCLVLLAFLTLCVLGVSNPVAAQISPETMAQMPSKEEVRQSLLASGMPPDQIEKVLGSMPFPDAVPEDLGQCADENNNDICDEEENNPAITTCRKNYVNIIERTARDLYGDYLGKNSLQVSQICGMASLGGTMYQRNGAWYADVRQHRVNPLIDYWETIRSYNAYLYGRTSENMPELPEDLDAAEIESLFAKLPPAFRDINNGDGDFRTRALPVFEKCEDIRRQVGSFHRREVVDNVVCLKHVPQSLEVPSDE